MFFRRTMVGIMQNISPVFAEELSDVGARMPARRPLYRSVRVRVSDRLQVVVYVVVDGRKMVYPHVRTTLEANAVCCSTSGRPWSLENENIYHLWRAFDMNSNVAGACGEIAVYKGKRWLGLLNPLGMCISVRQCSHLLTVVQSLRKTSSTRSRTFLTSPRNRCLGTSACWCVFFMSTSWICLLIGYAARSILRIQVHCVAERQVRLWPACLVLQG